MISVGKIKFLSITLSTRIMLTDDMKRTPNVGLRYAAQWLDGKAGTGPVSALVNVVLAASTALVLAAAPALAQDFSIDGKFVNPDATNGSFSDTAFDVNGTSVLMTEGSSIDVSDNAGDNAIQAAGDNITIDVHGARSTQGNNAEEDGNGIYIFGSNAVTILTETGTITTAGNRAHGQYIEGNDGRIENSGAIVTTGKDSYGQFLDGDGGWSHRF